MTQIERAVIKKIEERSNLGLSKYGVGMDRTDLSVEQWIRHAQEEAMDLAVYLERMLREIAKARINRDRINKVRGGLK